MTQLSMFKRKVSRLARTRAMPKLTTIAAKGLTLADLEKAAKAQTCRIFKATCGKCGYCVRVSRAQVNRAGRPRCAVLKHGPMVMEKKFEAANAASNDGGDEPEEE